MSRELTRTVTIKDAVAATSPMAAVAERVQMKTIESVAVCLAAAAFAKEEVTGSGADSHQEATDEQQIEWVMGASGIQGIPQG